MNINYCITKPKQVILKTNNATTNKNGLSKSCRSDSFCSNNSNISFTSTRVHKIVNNIAVNCNYTNVFRTDIDWGNLIEYLSSKYKNQSKVNIYCYACSDGSEPYSLAMKLIDKLGFKKSQKFFPIKARDIDEQQIQNAKNGFLYLSNNDITSIKNNLKHLKFEQLFKKDISREVSTQRNIAFTPYLVNPKLKELVDFSVSDIMQDALLTDFSNSVVMFRNAWTYSDLKAQQKLAKTMYDNMNNNSLLLIGNSDLFKSNACEYLKDTGLKPMKNGIFTNLETDYPSHTIGQPPAPKTIIPEDTVFVKE